MSDQDPRFFKGLQRNVPREPDDRQDVESSVYHWWWRFLRLSPAFWFAWRYELQLRGPEISRVYKNFDPLSRLEFFDWWKRVGRDLFAEARYPERVKVISGLDFRKNSENVDFMLLSVPLTIRRQTILRQFSALLAKHHEGRKLDLAFHSNAQYRLHTTRYRLSALENEYWVYVYRLLFPDIAVWRIGDRLQLAPHHKMRDSNGYIHRSPNAGLKSLQALTGRYLYKARFTLLNAERGSFPNAEAIKYEDGDVPFARWDQARYLKEISAHGKWHRWLSNRLLSDLTEIILEKNNINLERDRSPAWDLRLKDFVAGRSDLI